MTPRKDERVLSTAATGMLLWTLSLVSPIPMEAQTLPPPSAFRGDSLSSTPLSGIHLPGLSSSPLLPDPYVDPAASLALLDRLRAKNPGDVEYLVATAREALALGTLADIRSKHPRPIEVESVQSVEFTGGDRVFVSRGEDGWSLDSPSTEAPVDASAIEDLVEQVANVTVSGFPDLDPSAAGLVGARDRVIMKTDGGRVVLRLGDSVDDGRYVGYEGDDEVFTVAEFVADALTPSLDAVTGGGDSAGPGAGGQRQKRQKIEVLRGGKNKLKNLKQLKQQLGK